jgi:hypothetical protein
MVLNHAGQHQLPSRFPFLPRAVPPPTVFACAWALADERRVVAKRPRRIERCVPLRLKSMSYWKSVSKQAWDETAKLFGLDSVSKVLIVLMLQIFIPIGIFFLLGQTAFHDAVTGRLLAAGISFLLFPIFFFAKFVRTPPKMAAEAEAIRSELAQKAEKRAIDEDNLGGIAAYRNAGNGIRGRFSTTHGAAAIKSERVKWIADCSAYLTEHIGKTYADQFLAARATAMMGAPPGNPEGSNDYRDVQAKNEALKEILQELRRA